jgi:hypothetical protein
MFAEMAVVKSVDAPAIADGVNKYDSILRHWTAVFKSAELSTQFFLSCLTDGSVSPLMRECKLFLSIVLIAMMSS